MNPLVFFSIPIITFLLGLFVYFRSPKNRLNLLFFLMTVSMTIWMFFNISIDIVKSSGVAENLGRLDFATASIMVFFFLLFCINFPQTKKINSLVILILFLIALIFSLISLFTNLVVEGVHYVSSGYDIDYGPLELLYDGFIIAYVIVGGVGSLYLKHRKSADSEKKQITIMIIGLLLLALIVTGFNLSGQYLFPNIPTANRFGLIGFIIFLSFTGYSIVKKHLFDIRVILTETAVAIVLIALFIQTAYSANTNVLIISIIIFIIVTYGGYLLIKSVQQEIKRREELQRLSNQLAMANEHLKELDRMKTEFVSLASHELLTPVSAIEGYLSMLLDEKMAKIEDPKAIKYMDRVYSSAKRLARLVTDMLNVSRIEEGRLLVEKKEIDLSKLINETIEEIKFKAEENKQRIVFSGQVSGVSELKPETSNLKPEFTTYGDPDKLKEVVVNLIGNSIKYSKNPGTITITVVRKPTSEVAEKWQKVEDEIKARPLDDQEAIKSAVDEHFHALVGQEQLLISVKDQGIGIPKEELPRLFKKFHRVGDYTTAESQGTGLGLYISRALVELHHGRIWADSQGSGKGSTFTFSLPDISSKKDLLDLEAQVHQQKEQLKPLARPAKQAEDI